MTKIFKWRNYLVSYLTAILIINLVLLGFPLTNVFGYEFSVINSLLLTLLSGIYSIYFFHSSLPNKYEIFSKELLTSLILFLVVPFCISVVNSLINGFCSFWDGLFFYLVITLPSILIGSALGAVSLYFINRFQVALFIILYIGILSIIAFEIYFYPQIYVYNPILGFFPGTIYDEGIVVSGKLVLYRLFNIIFFGFIFFASVKQLCSKKKKINKSLTLITIVIAGLFYLFSSDLGYSTTANSLANALGRTITTKHFVIHYDKRLNNEQIKMLALNHEYYYQKLTEYFKSDVDEKINSFIFYDDDQKKELFGSKNADVAKPWLNQIYFAHENWDHTLKHELAHCFSATFGAGIFKLAAGFNPLLIEGIAESADGNYDDNDLHYMAALAYNSGYKVDLENLLTKTGFYSNPSSISYIYAGSFVKFLIDNYGIKKFKEYYLTGEYTSSYGVEIQNTLKMYYTFLENYKAPISSDEAHYYYGRKSLLQKVCPRAISLYINTGWEQLNNFNFDGAQNTFETVLGLTDNYSALVGLSRSYEKQDSILTAINLLVDEIGKFKGTSYFYNLELILGDLFAKNHDLEKADSLYTQLIEQFPNRKLYFIANTRKALLKNKNIFSEYLSGSNYDKYSILLKLNKKNYDYNSFPTIIDLSKALDESYNIFRESFDKGITVKDFTSSYASYLLSKYMLVNFDFDSSRKMASLSMRYDSDNNFNYIQQQQFEKAAWFQQHASQLLRNFKIKIYK
jgi:hypothetical protein